MACFPLLCLSKVSEQTFVVSLSTFVIRRHGDCLLIPVYIIRLQDLMVPNIVLRCHKVVMTPSLYDFVTTQLRKGYYHDWCVCCLDIMSLCQE